MIIRIIIINILIVIFYGFASFVEAEEITFTTEAVTFPCEAEYTCFTVQQKSNWCVQQRDTNPTNSTILVRFTMKFMDQEIITIITQPPLEKFDDFFQVVNVEIISKPISIPVSISTLLLNSKD